MHLYPHFIIIAFFEPHIVILIHREIKLPPTHKKKYTLIFLKLSTFQFKNLPTQNGYTNIQSFIQKRAEGVVFSPQTLYTSLVGVVYATPRP